MLGSMNRIALALGCEKAAITDFLGDCLEKPIKPIVVKKGLCQENVYTGDAVDLGRVPM